MYIVWMYICKRYTYVYGRREEKSLVLCILVCIQFLEWNMYVSSYLSISIYEYICRYIYVQSLCLCLPFLTYIVLSTFRVCYLHKIRLKTCPSFFIHLFSRYLHLHRTNTLEVPVEVEVENHSDYDPFRYFHFLVLLYRYRWLA